MTEARSRVQNPWTLTFTDPKREQRYCEFSYVHSNFYGGKLWFAAGFSINILFYVYYYGFVQGFDSGMFTNKMWVGLLINSILTVTLFAPLFMARFRNYREHIFLVTLASHWPAFVITAFFGMGDMWVYRFPFMVACLFFCTFVAQARIVRAGPVLLLSPLLTLIFATSFLDDYWTHTKGSNGWEVLLWLSIVSPSILLVFFEKYSRQAFLSMENSLVEIDLIGDQISRTEDLIARFFATTPTLDFLSHKEIDHRPRVYKNSNLIYSDIVSFTKWSSTRTAHSVTNHIGSMFERIDRLAKFFGVEKVVTVGDAYIGAIFPSCRGPRSAQRCSNACAFAVNILPTCAPLRMRVGVSFGDVIVAFVGSRPPRFDVFGDAATLAQNLETESIPGLAYVSNGTLAEAKELGRPADLSATDIALEDQSEQPGGRNNAVVVTSMDTPQQLPTVVTVAAGAEEKVQPVPLEVQSLPLGMAFRKWEVLRESEATIVEHFLHQQHHSEEGKPPHFLQLAKSPESVSLRQSSHEHPGFSPETLPLTAHQLNLAKGVHDTLPDGGATANAFSQVQIFYISQALCNLAKRSSGQLSPKQQHDLLLRQASSSYFSKGSNKTESSLLVSMDVDTFEVDTIVFSPRHTRPSSSIGGAQLVHQASVGLLQGITEDLDNKFQVMSSHNHFVNSDDDKEEEDTEKEHAPIEENTAATVNVHDHNPLDPPPLSSNSVHRRSSRTINITTPEHQEEEEDEQSALLALPQSFRRRRRRISHLFASGLESATNDTSSVSGMSRDSHGSKHTNATANNDAVPGTALVHDFGLVPLQTVLTEEAARASQAVVQTGEQTHTHSAQEEIKKVANIKVGNSNTVGQPNEPHAEDFCGMNPILLQFHFPRMEDMYMESILESQLVRKSTLVMSYLSMYFILCQVVLTCLDTTRNRLLVGLEMILMLQLQIVLHYSRDVGRRRSDGTQDDQDLQQDFGIVSKISTWKNTKKFDVYVIATFYLMNLASHCVTASCGKAEERYSGAIITCLFQNTCIAAQFMLQYRLAYRLVFNVVIVGSAVAGMAFRNVLFGDDVLPWDPLWAVNFLGATLGYFADYSLRAAFAAKQRLVMLKEKTTSEQQESVRAALEIMLPPFVLDHLLVSELVAVKRGTATSLLGANQGAVSPENQFASMNRTWDYDEAAILFMTFDNVLSGSVSGKRKRKREKQHHITPKTIATLHMLFIEIENILQRFGVFKIKTIGSSVLCVSGVGESHHLLQPKRNQSPAVKASQTADIGHTNADLAAVASVGGSSERHSASSSHAPQVARQPPPVATGVPVAEVQPVDALLETAAAVRQLLISRSASIDGAEQMQQHADDDDDAQLFSFRMGIHSGQCIGAVLGRQALMFDVFGDTVNVASRICGAAEPGTICVSSAIALKCSQPHLKISIKSRGMFQLKGKGSIEVFQFLDSIGRKKEE